MAQAQSTRLSWNRGRIIGPKPPLKPKRICVIRTRLLGMLSGSTPATWNDRHGVDRQVRFPADGQLLLLKNFVEEVGVAAGVKC